MTKPVAAKKAINIVNERKVYKEPDPEICHVSVKFVQDGNTLGTTEDYETIEINLEFQSSQEEGPFIVLKTEGWSINEPEDLLSLINIAKKVLL